MRNFLMMLAMLVGVSICSSCQSRSEKLASEYLSEYYDKYEIIECGEIDSVCSPFNFELFYGCRKARYDCEISEYELEYDKAFYARNKKLIKSYEYKIDSIRKEKNIVDSTRWDIYQNYDKQKKNCLGFEAKFRITYNSRIKKEYTYVFVLNPDGKSVGHLMNPIVHSTFCLGDNEVYGYYTKMDVITNSWY